ncbi:sarcosine oxidase subunit gamma [Pseudooceanicola antarcticus]|uniref:Sarcosine oxidase subunit gamma n=2 Tax=Pseudooceanicola antarcticus TaxID=1247613 RepID=A0A285JBN2_9RHOB|nr:sarcosine oxidase subunit gamma [Pseudooceanicola antarcticus]SNY57679.1 sarcosine oxidase subunit gamma [Pseudooceanicola antarcticus]
MAEPMLKAQNALPQGEALVLGDTRIDVLPMPRMTSLMPGPGHAALAKALRKHHGLDLPDPGGRVSSDEGECLWFGLGQYMLIGPAPSPLLAGAATLTEQSDAWTSVLLEGPLARQVLARLTPLDLRDASLPLGATARSEIAHMMGSLTRVGSEAFRLMVFRSMAQTLLHELKDTLEAVAARQAL